MDSQFYYVSVVITGESRLIKNELLRIDRPVNEADLEEFEQALDAWIKLAPVPGGEEPEFLVPLSEEVAEHNTTSQEDHLLRILDFRERFENFMPPDMPEDPKDSEGRPYDWQGKV